MAHITAHDGVAFPVADFASLVHCERTLADRALAGQYAPRIDAAVALASEFAHDPRVAPQVAAGPLVPADAPVDRFMADAQRAVLSEHADNLFGAPLSTQQPRHQRHVLDAEVRSAPTATSAPHSVAMRFLRAVLA